MNQMNSEELMNETVGLIKTTLSDLFSGSFLKTMTKISHQEKASGELEAIQSALVGAYGDDYPALLARMTALHLEESGLENSQLFKELLVENSDFKDAGDDRKLETILLKLVPNCHVTWTDEEIKVKIKNCPHHEDAYNQHPRLCPVSLITLVILQIFLKKRNILKGKRIVQGDDTCEIIYTLL